jgi:hypothetical protein
MLKIAHRGNTKGPSPRENHPFYIEEAIYLKFDVEVDVWLIKNQLWLGHDEPQYPTSQNFIDRYKNSLWIHCKNLEALEYFVNLKKDYKYFWHEKDSYTLTSNGLIWTYPKKLITSQSIVVLQDDSLPDNYKNAFGVCSDYVSYLDNK